MKEAFSLLKRLAEAADAYAADQSTATDPRCGIVQPVTVEQAEALNQALQEAWALIKPTAGT
jgi:hypothetical protein